MPGAYYRWQMKPYRPDKDELGFTDTGSIKINLSALKFYEIDHWKLHILEAQFSVLGLES